MTRKAFPILALALLSTLPLQAQSDLPSRLRAIASVVSVTELSQAGAATRVFSIDFEQPADHNNPAGTKFRQRVNLIHRSETAPMVMLTHGYAMTQPGRDRELTGLLGANQLQVEHRFFDASTPTPLTWPLLNIAQSSADLHRIVEGFKTIYTGKWVTTGGSKSGMTAVYHRFFYPNDVQATVAYVTPTSHGPRDGRYVPFVQRTGPADCRARLRAFQEEALRRRAEIIPRMTAASSSTFNGLGAERAYEFLIQELPFLFWQYRSEEACAVVPAPGASLNDLAGFINSTAGFTTFDDENLAFFAGYYYQAATELGAPRAEECDRPSAAQSALRQMPGRPAGTDPTTPCLLYRFAGEDVPAVFPPANEPKSFDDALMPAVEDWVLRRGERMLFIYGANDPWSANAYAVDPANDSHVLWVTGPRGNHGASIGALSDEDRAVALARLEAWFGVRPAFTQQNTSHGEGERRVVRPAVRDEQ